eukprot:7727634-Pyramimonas_sp.AAC.1
MTNQQVRPPGPLGTPRWPKMAPIRPKMFPTGAHEAPKTAPKRPKDGQRGSQEGPKNAHNCAST